MDDDLKAKVNPTIIVILDYLSVGVLVGIYFYMAVIAKVVSADSFSQILVALLAGLGIYKSSTFPIIPPVNNKPPVSLNIVPGNSK